MAYAIGRGVRVEMGTTEGSEIAVSAVTSANPPVATATAHSLTAKSLGYFTDVKGMPLLDGQACRLSAVDTNTFTLQDLDATDYGTYTAGDFVPVTAWTTLSAVTDYNKSGGEANPQDTTTILDTIQQQINGPLSAESVSFSARTETISSSGMAALRAAAKTQTEKMFRITLSDGSVRFFRGAPSLPTENVAQGGVGQTSFSVNIKGVWCEGAA